MTLTLGIHEQEKGLETYFSSLKPHPCLSQEQEDHEMYLWKTTQDDHHKEIIALSNARFVVSIAKDYTRRGVALSDLIQEGNIGLLESLEQYSAIGHRFASYAVRKIRWAISDALQNTALTVRIPAQYPKVHKYFQKRVDHEHTSLEGRVSRLVVADMLLHTLPWHVRQGLMMTRNPSYLSVDDESYEARNFTATYADTLHEGEDALLADISYQQALAKMEESLTTTEFEVLSLYYGLGAEEAVTLDEIGQRIHKSRQQTGNIKDAALLKLRTKHKAFKAELF